MLVRFILANSYILHIPVYMYARSSSYTKMHFMCGAAYS